MNYSVELWNNYNKAQKTLHFHLQGLKDIITLYTDQYNYQQSYALFLKKKAVLVLSIILLDDSTLN